MAKLNLSQAAKATGKNRTTIWRHINTGKLSSERDRDGMPFVDTSELLRVYGELKHDATPERREIQHNATPTISDLLAVIEKMRIDQLAMKEQLQLLTNRLTYQGQVITHQIKQKPEDHPDWPKEVSTMADVALRNEIKERLMQQEE